MLEYLLFENQPKTFPEPPLTPMYASAEKRPQVMMATYGKPDRDVRAKIFGAFPTNARPSTYITR